jgi:hypothetical protein
MMNGRNARRSALGRFTLVCCACVVAASAAHAARGRVLLSESTIVSDWGTLLRGPCWGMPMHGNRGPSRQQLEKLKSLGMNTLHVWPECYRYNPGANVNATAETVRLCDELGIYAIICYGCCEKNAQYFYDRVTNFWKIYAERFKNDPHVVFEIQNEPSGNTFAYEDHVITMFQDCYNIIRERAPDTHILFFTYCNIYCGPDPVLVDVSRMAEDIDWSNASVAYHGYMLDAGPQRDALKVLTANGVRMTCTEWAEEDNVSKTRIYEECRISWTNFIQLDRLDKADIDKLVNAGIRWNPDYGNYPLPSVTRTCAAAKNRARPYRTTVQQTFGRVVPIGGSGASVRLPAEALRLYDLRGRILLGTGNERGGGRQRGLPDTAPFPGTGVLLFRTGAGQQQLREGFGSTAPD